MKIITLFSLVMAYAFPSSLFLLFLSVQSATCSLFFLCVFLMQLWDVFEDQEAVDFVTAKVKANKLQEGWPGLCSLFPSLFLSISPSFLLIYILTEEGKEETTTTTQSKTNLNQILDMTAKGLFLLLPSPFFVLLFSSLVWSLSQHSFKKHSTKEPKITSLL